MKKIAISLIFTTVATISLAQTFVIDSIKYISSENNFINSNRDEKIVKYRTFTYNNDGQCLTENYWIDDNDNPSVVYSYEYDNNSNLTRQSTNFYNEGLLEEISATEYIYYDNDLLKSMVEYTYGRMNKREIKDSAFYKYDDLQRLYFEYKKCPNDETRIYDFDELGNIVKATTYNKENEVIKIERRGYNKEGRIMYKQETRQTEKDSIDYSYNENGLLKQEQHFTWNNDGYIYSQRIYYYYNDENLLIKRHEDQYYKSHGKFFGSYEEEFEYDANGNITCNHYKGLKNGNIVDKGVKTFYGLDINGNTTKIHKKTYEGGTWKNIPFMEDIKFSYNNGNSIFNSKINSDVTSIDYVLISYLDSKDIPATTIQDLNVLSHYTIKGDEIRFNINEVDFKYIIISNLAGHTQLYLHPVAKLSKGINLINIKTGKGFLRYKILTP